MPRVIHTTVYTYDELNDKAKAKARDWFREGSSGDNFFAESMTCEGGDFETVAKFCGWTINANRNAPKHPAIYWSGFWSQGDGLCFEGSWCTSDVDATGLKEHAPTDTALHTIVDAFAKLAAEYPPGSGTSRHVGHYYHAYSVSLELDGDGESEQEPTAAMDETFREQTRALMQWMYRSLEAEYDYQNSDEQVAETIRVNEYDFTEDGKRA